LAPAAFLALTATVLVAALTPGPAVTAIVARALADGLRPAQAINAGVVTGDLVFFMLAAAGMAAVARSHDELFTVLRFAGAGYLVWAGIRLWRVRPRPVLPQAAGHDTQFWRNYGAGLLLMLGHVQAILFYAALLPGFVDFSVLTASDFALIALMLVVVIGGVNSAYASAAARARHLFANEHAQLVIHRAAGTLLLVAAALVATRV
jgi:threonine/homoserine/homoserine lactone efflux protein